MFESATIVIRKLLRSESISKQYAKSSEQFQSGCGVENMPNTLKERSLRPLGRFAIRLIDCQTVVMRTGDGGNAIPSGRP